jgi:hypothetical protein
MRATLQVRLAEREGIRTLDTVARVPHSRRLKPLSHLSCLFVSWKRLGIHEECTPGTAWISLVLKIPMNFARRSVLPLR